MTRRGGLCIQRVSFLAVPEIVPTNALEIALRPVLRDKTTPLWSFYTPLGAARLWIFAQHYPELDGSDLIAPEGQNPNLCVFKGPEDALISVYTAERRAEEVFAKAKLHPATYTIISALGFEILRLIRTSYPEVFLWVNLWADGQYLLDDDMVDILLSRPAPPPLEGPLGPPASFAVAGEPERYLDPLREFLAGQPNVRAAWIAMMEPEAPLAPGGASYVFHLLMRDPEDDSLLEKVRTMAKALTPLGMEWTSAMLLGDDKSLGNLAKMYPPFYEAADFPR